MSERGEHGRHGAITAPEDDPRILPSLVAGVLGVVGTVLVILGLETLHYRTQDALVERSFDDVSSSSLAERAAEQRELLGAYRWVDRERGVVSIPIERAMELVVRESAGPDPDRGGEP
jgi:hypothetical protein